MNGESSEDPSSQKPEAGEDQGSRTKGQRTNKTGMSKKTRAFRKCDRPIKDSRWPAARGVDHGMAMPQKAKNAGTKPSSWRYSLVKINPSKLLKTQARCPEADKTIPISDTLRVERMQCSPLPFLGRTGTC